AALSDTKAGLPVKNGSISTALPAKSSRKAEWPYQVICMMVVLGSGRSDWAAGRYATGRQDQCSRAGIAGLDPATHLHAKKTAPRVRPRGRQANAVSASVAL